LLRNDAARAEAAFTELAEQPPPSGAGTTELPEALNNLGVARARLGKSREAAEAFARATKADPDDPDYWFNLGLAEMRLNDPAAAVEPFREVLRRQPRDAKAHALLVKALKESERASEASAVEEAWSRQGGKAEASPSLSGDALPQLDRIKMRVESAAAYPAPDAAAGGELGAPPAHRAQNRAQHVARGRQLLAAGKLEDAEREFLAALSAAPFDPVAHRGLAEVYRLQGRPDDAVRELRAALEIQDDAATRTALARLYVEQHRPAEAREQLRLALKLDPGNAEARQLLAELQSRTGPGDHP
jgi:Tfp pilus assembly protein PilF